MSRIAAASKHRSPISALICRIDSRLFKQALKDASEVILMSGTGIDGRSGSCVMVFRADNKGPIKVSMLRQNKK